VGKPGNWKALQNKKKSAVAMRQGFDTAGALNRTGAGPKKGHGMIKEELRAQAAAAVANFAGEVRKVPTILPGDSRKTRSNREL